MHACPLSRRVLRTCCYWRPGLPLPVSGTRTTLACPWPGPSQRPHPLGLVQACTPVNDEVPVQVLEAPEHLQHDALDLCRGQRAGTRWGSLALASSGLRSQVAAAAGTGLATRGGAWSPSCPAGTPGQQFPPQRQQCRGPRGLWLVQQCRQGEEDRPTPHTPGPQRRAWACSPGGWPGPAHSTPSPERCWKGKQGRYRSCPLLGQQKSSPGRGRGRTGHTSPGGSPPPPPSAPRCWDGGRGAAA